MQNDMLELFYRRIMRNIVHKINECRDFGVMTDEGSDSSNAEPLSSAVRKCNERLECDECWLLCQALDNIKSDTIVKGLKMRKFFYECSLL